MVAVWIVVGGGAAALGALVLLRRRSVRLRAARALSRAADRLSPFPNSD